MGEKIQLREDNPDVFLTAYRPERLDSNRAVIICPGGGYRMVSQSEGEPIALRFAEAGYHAYVLSYSVGDAAELVVSAKVGMPESELKPIRDIYLAFEAVKQDLTALGNDSLVIASTVAEHSTGSARQSKDTKKIILCGFSAGAHAAATYVYSPSFCANPQNPRFLPSALILAYPPIDISWLDVVNETYSLIDIIFKASETARAIPVFVWNAANDRMVNPQDSVKIVEELQTKGADCTYLCDEDGIHGRPLYDDAWFGEMLNWLNRKL